MNTFFFGYLSLKWRRLVRTLLVIGFLILVINFIWGEFEYETIEYKMILMTTYIVPIPLISWLVKPFIVKEKS
jgi:TRAP-type C4-dicarboxylate transport system permease small subunit